MLSHLTTRTKHSIPSVSQCWKSIPCSTRPCYTLPPGITNCLNVCKYLPSLKLTENEVFYKDCLDFMKGKLMVILIPSRSGEWHYRTLQLVLLFPAAHYFLCFIKHTYINTHIPQVWVCMYAYIYTPMYYSHKCACIHTEFKK